MSASPFRIDPDIRRAQTAPKEIYTDPEWWPIQKERLFTRSWHLAPTPRRSDHAVEPWTLLPGCLDEEVVWARDEAGQRRCLSNVCTHRGAPVVEAAGCPKRLRCPYHGRSFHLDGRIDQAPGFEQALDFPQESDDLPRLQTGEWEGFGFVGLHPEQDFADWIAPLAQGELAFLADGRWPDRPGWERDFEIDANWALYVENFLEGFHIPFVHQGLAAAIDWPSYRTTTSEWGVLQSTEVKEGEPAFPTGKGAYYLWLFPCTMLNFYPWGLSLNIVEPLAFDRTRVRYRFYIREPELLERGAGAALEVVEGEDDAIVEAVQRGVRSRNYRHGRYSPEHEIGTHHFHRLLARTLCSVGTLPSVLDI